MYICISWKHAYPISLCVCLCVNRAEPRLFVRDAMHDSSASTHNDPASTQLLFACITSGNARWHTIAMVTACASAWNSADGRHTRVVRIRWPTNQIPEFIHMQLHRTTARDLITQHQQQCGVPSTEFRTIHAVSRAHTHELTLALDCIIHAT